MTADALAEAVAVYLAAVEQHQSLAHPFDAMRAAYRRHESHRAAEPKRGEKVRLAGWYNEHERNGVEVYANYDPTDSAWGECPKPDFYIEFPLPPRTTPPVIDGEVLDGQ